MPPNLEELCQQARELSDTDKLVLLDALLAQLDRPDPELDHIWAGEVRRRRQAYRAGRLEARDYEQVMESFPHR